MAINEGMAVHLPVRILSIFWLRSLSLLCLGFFVLFGILNNNWFDPLSIVLLVVAIIVLILALLLFSAIKNGIKKADQFVRTIVYDLQEDNISFEIYRDEEMIETGKIYYKDLEEYKETKHYVYVGLKNNTWLAIDKVDGLVDLLKSKGLTKFKAVKFNKKK